MADQVYTPQWSTHVKYSTYFPILNILVEMQGTRADPPPGIWGQYIFYKGPSEGENHE